MTGKGKTIAPSPYNESGGVKTICPHPADLRAGIVTNNTDDGQDRERSTATVAVCGDPACRARALGWVRRMTGEEGTYISDSSRRK